MRYERTGPLAARDWEQLIDGEPEPFGGEAEDLSWREKSAGVCVRDDTGRPLAAGGVVVAAVSVAGSEPFPVAGIGGVIVTRSARGRGLGRAVIERLLGLAAELPAQRAMLFCVRRNIALYAKFGFSEIAAPVTVQQRAGPVQLPIHAMWMPLTPGVSWPEGPVELLGEPF